MSSGERERLSWSEIDKRRDGARSGGSSDRPQFETAASKEATQQYLNKLDKQLFSKGKRSAEETALGNAVRDAHGTSGLTEACHAYQKSLGLPVDPILLAVFLDARDPELVVAIVDSIAPACEAETLEMTSGLRAQLKVLAQDVNDAIAEAAEICLENIEAQA